MADIIKMRHTVVVRGTPATKNAEFSCQLQGVQDGQCLKLTQNQQHIYLVYRMTENMGMRHAQVNCYLLELNGMESDAATSVEQLSISGLQHLVVEVSELDWKIVSVNQLKIAESFLEQVSVVWPNAQLPIYYEGSNYVVLKALTQRVGRLSVNTTVEFIDKSSERRAEEREESLQQEQSVQVSLTLAKQHDYIDNGYINRIFIGDRAGQLLQLNSTFWITVNQLEFSRLPTVTELVEEQKTREKKSKENNEQEISSKRLALVEIDVSLGDGEFSCSKQMQELLNLSQVIYISNEQQYRPKMSVLSLDLFLKEENLTICINRLQVTAQESSLSAESKTLAQLSLAKHIIDVLFQKKEFYLLQDAYPYLLDGSLYTMTLTHKIDNKIRQKLHRLALIGRESSRRKEECISKMKNKLIFMEQGFGSQQFLHEQYATIQKWIKVMQQNKKISHGLDLRSQQAAEKVFQAIYKQQIDKIHQFLNSYKHTQKICVVSSFGSNGKSFLHEYLSRHGQRMWKVNFRQLNSPSLSFKEIEFYLEWVFANSPYRSLFFDDFDSLCDKVDEGDQLRKRERTIGKLILRKVNFCLETYRVKLIVTARSESALDQQLSKHITVVLRNPTRQLRLKAMQSLNERWVQESRIKRITSQQGAEIERESSHINEIVQATESLTYGAFVKHATTFSKPKNAKSDTLNDLSKIAGLKTVKSTIRSIVQKPIKYAFLFKSVPIKLPRGILLYGATGNGKSAIGAAVQDEFKMKYFSVKGSDILSKYIGGSEAAVRDIFERALAVSPSIIFFDQFESIVPKRSANNTGVNDRIVNQFLCYLDGVSAISGVYILAASSRPDMIDPAVLRPGRLDAHLFLDYPQAEEREQLVRMYQRSIKLEVDTEQIVKMTANFSYSDMVGLFKELRIKRSAQVLQMEHYTSQDFIQISRTLLEQTLANFKLSVTPKEQKKQRQLYLNFQNGVGPDPKQQKQIQY